MTIKSAKAPDITPNIGTLNHFSRHDLEVLLEHTTSPMASIYVSHQPGESGDVQAGRLKTAVHRARTLFDESGLRRDEAEQILAPAAAHVDALRVARGPRTDLALFVSAAGTQGFRVPHPVDDAVIVGHDPHIVPLIGELPPQPHTVVVSVSKNNTHAFSLTPWEITTTEIDGLPTSVADVAATGDRENMLQRRKIRPASGDATLVHGHGGAKDVEDIVRDQFLHAVELSLQRFLRRNGDQIVLAGVAETTQELRTRLASDQVIGVVTGNYDHRESAELRTDAQHVINDVRRARLRKQIAAFREHAGNGLVTNLVDDVAAAAAQGRVELLVLPQLHHFSSVHGSAVATVNRSAIDTLVTSGSVIIAPDEDANGLTLPAALLRF